MPTTSLDLDLTTIEDVTPDTSRMVPIAGGVRATLLADRTQPPQLKTSPNSTAVTSSKQPSACARPNATAIPAHGSSQTISSTRELPPPPMSPPPSSISWQTSCPVMHPQPPLHCRIFAAQSWAAARLLAYTLSTANRRLPPRLRLTPDDAGMLNAMLFGDRSRLTHQLRLGFERTGSFHLFVVSGMHVALLAGLVFWIARRLRLRNWLATLLTLALTYAYALVTGFGVPVQRALLMTAVFLLARLLSRQRNTLNALGAAALAVLIWSPRALFEASFQMTFLAIVAIAGIAMPLGERSFLPYARAARNLHHTLARQRNPTALRSTASHTPHVGRTTRRHPRQVGLLTPRKDRDYSPLGRSTRADRPHRRSRHGASHGHGLPSRHRLRAARQHDLYSPDRSPRLARPRHLSRVAGKPVDRRSAWLRAGVPAAWGHRRNQPHQPRAGRRPARSRPHTHTRSRRRRLLRLLLLGRPPFASLCLGRSHRPPSRRCNRPLARAASRPSQPARSRRHRCRPGRLAAGCRPHWPRHAHRRRWPRRGRRQRRERRPYLLHLRHRRRGRLALPLVATVPPPRCRRPHTRPLRSHGRNARCPAQLPSPRALGRRRSQLRTPTVLCSPRLPPSASASATSAPATASPGIRSTSQCLHPRPTSPTPARPSTTTRS